MVYGTNVEVVLVLQEQGVDAVPMSTHGAKYYDLEEEFLRSLYDISDYKEFCFPPGVEVDEVLRASLVILKHIARFKTTALVTTKWVVYKNRFGVSNVSLSLKARQALFDRYVVLAERSGRATPLDIAEVRAKLLT